MSNTLCSFVFGHTDIEPNGDIKFCCAAEAGLHRDSEGRVYNVTTHSLKEAWNSDLLKKTRLEMIEGKKPSVCNYCWSMENADNTQGASIRLQAANRRILLEEIQDRIDYARAHDGELDKLAFDFQLSIGNLCNFACKMCNPGFSTQYQKFFSKFHKNNQQVNFVLNPNKAVKEHFEFPFGTTFDWPVTHDLMEIFKDHIPDVKKIFFTGGEPTLIPEVMQFIENLAAAGKTNDLMIWPSTNCSNINKKMLSTLEKFQELCFNLSLDGMDDIAYLQRTPSHWPSIEKNVDQLMNWVTEQRQLGKEIQVVVITTVTALNFHHVLDFWQYFDTRYGQHTEYGFAVNLVLNKDTNLGIEAVPKQVADIIKNRCNDLLNTANQTTEYAFKHLRDIISITKFSNSYDEIHYCLDQLQKYHPNMNIKEIYKIYYE